jgi:hypothetical protein
MVAWTGVVHFRVSHTCPDIKQKEFRLRGDQVLRFSWYGRFHSDLYFFRVSVMHARPPRKYYRMRGSDEQWFRDRNFQDL